MLDRVERYPVSIGPFSPCEFFTDRAYFYPGTRASGVLGRSLAENEFLPLPPMRPRQFLASSAIISLNVLLVTSSLYGQAHTKGQEVSALARRLKPRFARRLRSP